MLGHWFSALFCRLTGGHDWIYNAYYSERICVHCSEQHELNRLDRGWERK